MTREAPAVEPDDIAAKRLLRVERVAAICGVSPVHRPSAAAGGPSQHGWSWFGEW